MDGSKIKRIRGKAELSQAEFAERIGVSVRTLQDWEQDRHTPRGAALALLKMAESNPGAFKRKG